MAVALRAQNFEGQMPDEERPMGIIRIPSSDKPKISQEPSSRPPPKTIRAPVELVPLARQIAANVELMGRFREAMGSGNEDLARKVVDEVRQHAQTLDPSLTYADGATVNILLMEIIGNQSGDRNDQ